MKASYFVLGLMLMFLLSLFGCSNEDTNSQNMSSNQTKEQINKSSITKQQNSSKEITKEVPKIFNLKLNELSCVWNVAVKENVRRDCITVISKGTASGPIGARLELPILVWSTDEFDCGVWTKKAGALIAVGHTCFRQEGQPEQTNWTVTAKGCPLKDYFQKEESYSVKIYENDDIFSKKEDKKSVACQ